MPFPSEAFLISESLLILISHFFLSLDNFQNAYLIFKTRKTQEYCCLPPFLVKTNVFSLSSRVKVGYTNLSIGTQENTIICG